MEDLKEPKDSHCASYLDPLRDTLFYVELK